MTKARDLANASTALSAVSATELAFVDGVTSAIQTQMDAKAPSSTAATLSGTQTLTNKTIDTASNTITGAVTLTGTQTLTNKTLTSPVISSVINNTLTSTTGDIIYASAANTPARLGIGSSAQVLTVASGVPSWATPASGASFYGCSLYKSAAQSMANATVTTITFNNELLDVGGYHDNATNNSRITIPSGKAGYYMIQAKLSFGANATGQRTLFLKLNGSSTILRIDQSISSTNEDQYCQFSQLYNCIVGDYFEIQGYQNSGGSLVTGFGAEQGTFAITYLGA